MLFFKLYFKAKKSSKISDTFFACSAVGISQNMRSNGSVPENLATTQIYTHIENTELKLAAEANPLAKLDYLLKNEQ